MDRRTFLGTVAAAGFGAAFEAHSAGESGQFAGVAAGTFVWTQVLSKQGKDPKENLDLIFEEVHSAGYEGVETFADYVATPVQAARITELLDKHQLKLTGLYRGGVLHEEEKAKRAVDEIGKLAGIAFALDCPHIIVNPDPLHDREKTEQELDIQAQNLNKAGELAKVAGVCLNLHFHAPELRNDGRELRWDMDKTDPALVFLCDDVHWMYRGGVDPYALLEKYG
nr:sugar phosphate isomerase/epimerase [bacterium]